MRVLLGITGGIAAYKAASLIRLFTENGHSVSVVPTENALRFIGKPTLEALSGQPVDVDMYANVADVKHVALGANADLIVVAPATAAFLARLAHGLADDLLLNAILASTARVVVAPAMHTEMWQNAATVANVELLRQRGVQVMPPATGRLTGADSGPGRLPEPEEIYTFALAGEVSERTDTPILAGVDVLVTAGGTRENLDPVRFIGNHSSGKQGLAFARQALRLGANVRLIACNLELDLLRDAILGATVVHVTSVNELSEALQNSRADLLVMAAAVSDFTIATSETKLRRGEVSSLALKPTADLLANWARAYPQATTIAFALEDSPDLVAAAQKKLVAKGVSAVIANRPSALGSDSNTVMLVTASASEEISGSKDFVASSVLLRAAAIGSSPKAKL